MPVVNLKSLNPGIDKGIWSKILDELLNIPLHFDEHTFRGVTRALIGGGGGEGRGYIYIFVFCPTDFRKDIRRAEHE